MTDVTNVTQRRNEGAVGNLGVIETGLPTKRATQDKSSLHSCSYANSELRIGRATLQKCEVISRSASICGAKKKVAVHVKNQVLLHPLRVDIPAGSITAILGSAGSGKSTLLKFLAGHMDRNVAYEGKVNLPGSKSFLQQETNLHRFYTPRTYIKHYQCLKDGGGASGYCNIFRGGGNCAKDSVSTANSGSVDGIESLKRSQSASARFDDEGIEKLLDALRIDLDRRDTICGDVFKKGLNPSEERRLDLGLMVLGAPDTLFCESPVQGLDSETSLHIMEFLKGYISNDPNRRVIVTLDRPSLFVWNLIDNVILLSKGRVVYEGPRFDMESFFAFHKKPTPARFSPLEHYLAVVNNFREDTNAVNWETAFKQWQEKVDEDEGDDLADDIETCFPTAIPEVLLISTNSESSVSSCWGKCLPTFLELLHRSILHTIKNPGILGLRILMYTPFTLFLGLLFFNLNREESYESVNSMAALLFYSSSFYIFMVVAILPFLAKERLICRKEVLNGFYHPTTQHLAMTVGSIPRVVILSLIITLILAGMVKLNNPVHFFCILLLALWNAESYAILMSICVRNYILGIIILAGIFGLAMPLEGFMLVPSMFPGWLRWLYLCPFHTYVFRSLMYNEFSGSSFGEKVLQSYEIEDTNIKKDMTVLVGYSVVIHCVSVAVLLFCHRGKTRKQKDS